MQSVRGKTYFVPIVNGGTLYKYGVYLSDKLDTSTISAFDQFRADAKALSGHKIYRHQHGLSTAGY
jgi:hypothetical protein